MFGIGDGGACGVGWDGIPWFGGGGAGAEVGLCIKKREKGGEGGLCRFHIHTHTHAHTNRHTGIQRL